MKKSIVLSFVFIALLNACCLWKSKNEIALPQGPSLQFYIVVDAGRNGYYKQKDVAIQMGKYSEQKAPKFIISCGDLFHINGVGSTQDPVWLTNFELVYTHPNLLCDWYPVLGNHEYKGNTKAVIDYSTISRRWAMPARYVFICHKRKKNSRFFLLCNNPKVLVHLV